MGFQFPKGLNPGHCSVSAKFHPVDHSKIFFKYTECGKIHRLLKIVYKIQRILMKAKLINKIGSLGAVFGLKYIFG